MGIEIENYLSSFSSTQSVLAPYLYSKILGRKQQYSEAITSLSKISSSSSFAKAAKLAEFYINLNGLNDASRAEELLHELSANGSKNDIALKLAQHDFATVFQNAQDEIGKTKGHLSKSSGIQPLSYSLSQNFPNPFNPSTSIKFSIQDPGNVELKIYDVLGKEVTTLVNGYKEAGNYTESFDASRLSNGVYLYKITSGSFIAIKKMILLK